MRVMHPASLNRKSGALTTFADAHEGMDIVMLDAAPETMAKNISKSARALTRSKMSGVSPRRSRSSNPASPRSRAADFETEDVVGALSIFCSCLVMAIDDRMPLASEQLFDAVGHSTMMGICCFGEQGTNCHASAIHGNLMYGCLLFSNLDAAGL